MLLLVLILMSTLVLILKWIDWLVLRTEVLLKALALLNALALLRVLGLLFRLFDELLDCPDIIGFFILKTKENHADKSNSDHCTCDDKHRAVFKPERSTSVVLKVLKQSQCESSMAWARFSGGCGML
jgi:hypothetical protein